MEILVAIIIFAIVAFIVNQVGKNRRADDLMKAHGLSLEDRVYLMKMYGPSGIDEWVILRYMTEKSRERMEKGFETFFKENEDVYYY